MLDGEKDIILRAIRGEASAFGLLYDHYEPRIYRFIYLKVGYREEAEDLTSQVFLQSLKRIGDFQYQDFPFSSWLYRIARNEVIDYYRVRKVHIDIETIETESDFHNFSDEKTALRAEEKIDLERIKKAIPRLTPIEQDVLIMRFVEDMSPAEVATAVGKTSLAVRLIQHRAIKNLRKILGTDDKDSVIPGFTRNPVQK